MSESKKSPCTAAEEEQNEDLIQNEQARTEQELIEAEAISPTAEEDQETVIKKSRNKNSQRRKVIGRDEKFQHDNVG